MTPIVGERLGPYEILGRLGRGGMGLVYRGWDGRLRREVAIKLLHHEYPVPGSRERFLQEARAASALNHPHICTVFDIGEKDGAPYLVMELMEGETLKERIEHSPLSVDELVRYAMETADALGAAHARGIVHRDIKPANIFLVEQAHGGRQTKVLDFGLAKVERRMGERLGLGLDRRLHSSSEGVTSEGTTVGTVAYMSPEQARGEALDGRSDLFSLGVVMYEMATRRRPFQGSSNAVTFVQLLNHEPEPMRDWNESVPRGLEKIILQLLAKGAEERFQTAAEVGAALHGLGKAGGGWLRRATPTPVTPVVPLVRTGDPVARDGGGRGRRRAGDAEGNGVGFPQNSNTKEGGRREGSGGPGVLRPLSHSPELNSVSVVLPERVGTDVAAAGEADYAGVVVGDSERTQPGRDWPEGQSLVGEMRKGMGSAAALVAEDGTHPAIADESLVQETDMSESDGLVAVDAIGGEDEDEPPGRRARRLRRRVWIGCMVFSALVWAAVGVLVVRGLRSTALGPDEWLMVTAIENQTGDRALDGTVAQGLEIALAELPDVALRSGGAYEAALRRIGKGFDGSATQELARQAALAAGAKAYLYGSVSKGDGPDFRLAVQMLDTASNRELVSVEESAAGREEIPAAISRVVARLREKGGLGRRKGGERAVAGTGASDGRFDVPLGSEATGSVDALHAYSVGVEAMADGRTGDALNAFQSAVRIDPTFVQALLQLAWIYRGQHAERASADAARLAEHAAGMKLATSTHTALLAQYSLEVNATGDLERARAVIRRFAVLYPHDGASARGLTRVLRLQGRFGEALDAAERGLKDDPYDGDLYVQAEFSLIAMDRYDAALGVEQRAEQMGLPQRVLGGTAVTAAYLADKDDRLASAIEWVTRPPYSVSAMAAYGLYLDNTGQFAAGTTLWQNAGGGAGWMLAQGAVDRALVGECELGLEMARRPDVDGMASTFNVGMAAALCGDKKLAQSAIEVLSKDWGQAWAVRGYYLPDLLAAVALGGHDPQGALDALQGARPYDLVSLTPYLRGLAHGEMHENELSVVDFQTVLGHRGVAITGGSDVYPMAEIGLARAYAASGDRTNSGRAYRRFLELWRRGDAGVRLRVEAEGALGR